MKFNISLIICTCILFSFISCAPAVSPKIGFQSVAQNSKVIFTRQKGEKYTLSKYLKVVKLFSKIDENGLLNCAIVFNNNRYKKDRNLTVDIQFIFYDENGIEVEKTNWQPTSFPSGVDVTVKQVSMNPDTRDYKVFVRGPRVQNW